MSAEPSIDPVVASLRDEITSLDVRIVATINARIAVVQELRRHKAENGIAFLDPDREVWLVEHLKRVNEGPLSDEGAAELAAFVLDLVKREVARG